MVRHCPVFRAQAQASGKGQGAQASVGVSRRHAQASVGVSRRHAQASVSFFFFFFHVPFILTQTYFINLYS
jgi:hypothetical protein